MERNSVVAVSLILGICAIAVATQDRLIGRSAVAQSGSQVKVAPQIKPVLTPTKDILTQASLGKDRGMALAALRRAGLEKTLKGEGPFTVFAPVDTAFSALPQNVVNELMKSKDRAELRAVMKHHLVRGKYDSALLKKLIQDSPKNKAKLVTLTGGSLFAMLDGDSVVLLDAQGNRSRLMDPDHHARNGVIHDIDGIVQAAPFSGFEKLKPGAPVLAE